MNAESIQIGTCPICQNVLARDGEFVVCPKGDYKAEFTKWDEVWKAFDAKNGDGEKLVKDLVGLKVKG